MTRSLWSALLVLILSTGAQAASPAQAPSGDGKVPREGFDLHYRIFGNSGPFLIVLAGGPGADPSYMQPVVEELSTKYQCLLLEQRGTGRSKLPAYDSKSIHIQAYLEDLEALRTHLKQEKLLLAGHSWGAMLALSFAGTYADRVRAVLSLDSGPIAEDHAVAEEQNVRRRLLSKEQKEIANWERRRAQEPVRAFGEIQRLMIPAYFYDRQKSLQSAHWMSRDTNIAVMRLGYEPDFGSLQEHIRSRLAAIQAPVLLVHGRQDAVAEGSVVEAHHLIKGSQLVLLNQCGHMSWIEQPQQLWKAVNQFLDAFTK